MAKSDKVVDKTGPFRETLGARVAGTKYVYNLRASNTRTNNFGGRFALSVGGFATGTVNLRTEQVKVNSYAMVR